MVILFSKLSLGEVSGQNKLPYFRAGLSLFIAGVGTDDEAYEDSGTYLPGLTLNPGLRIINGTGVSVSISTPITLGILMNDADDESTDESNDFGFGYDLPIVADITFGLGASSSRQQPFGLMVGYGVGYHRSYLSSEIDGIKKESTVAFSGQLFHMGLIFPIDRNKEENEIKGVMVRLSIMEKQSPLNPFAFSIGAILLFKSMNQ